MLFEPGKDFERTRATVSTWKVGLGVEADIYYFAYSFNLGDLLYDELKFLVFAWCGFDFEVLNSLYSSG